ncbi:Hypothetical_protein [Hexamita inflata]|uniref:Hypothetical_protein n=1 Tax=Hexamita inflata TaxID=28002 RepID=A0AA86Q4Z7_9EUKA|nr:Hypothetical protein HINF_LOCUS37403 [Hexamita inflata]
MLYFLSIQNLVSPIYTPVHGFSLSYLSNISNVIDAIECEDAIFIIIQNNSILGMGDHDYFFGENSQLDFTNIKVIDAAKLSCDQSKLSYLSTSGQFFQEDKGIFIKQDLGVQNIRQLILQEDSQFILSDQGIYFRGRCSEDNKHCGSLEAKTYVQFTLIPTKITAKNIKSIYVEVFAIGNNFFDVLPSIVSDVTDEFVHFIGSGITSVRIGFEQSINSFAVYYVKLNSLYLYAMKQETCIQKNVHDFITYGEPDPEYSRDTKKQCS